MKALSVACLALFLFVAPALAKEQVNLTAPDQVRAGTSTYVLKELNLDWVNKTVVVVLRGSNGENKEVVYGEDDGSMAMLRSLNKVDLSVKSLHRRIMERLLADGHLVGSISGAPD